MSAAEDLYSNDEIIRERGNTDGSANSQVEVSLVKRRLSAELPDGRCRVTSERAAVFVLSVLLAAYLITLGLHSYQNIQTIERLQKVVDERDAVIKNLTAKYPGVKPCKPESPKCPEVNRDSRSKCPEGWEHHGGKCYYFSTGKSTWTESRDECRRKGGDLVKIESREEQTFLEYELRGKMTEAEDRFWIGLTDSETEGRWLWTDRSELDSSLSFWFKGEPDNYKKVNPDGENCARMGEKGGAPDLKCWFDAPCQQPYKSICEKPGEPSL